MYFSYFEENSHDVAMWFDKERCKAEKPKMMELLAKLKTRLDEVNDGSFWVQDDITDQYKKLEEPEEIIFKKSTSLFDGKGEED